jgi:hypothetical protein
MPKSKEIATSAYLGMVYECQQSGRPCAHVAVHDTFRTEYQSLSGGMACILFLCAGADEEEVRAVVQAICKVEVDRKGAGLFATVPAQQPGDQYVYGYFHIAQAIPAAPVWAHGFYVGKGTVSPRDGLYGGRWTEHVKDACTGGTLPRHHSIRAQLPRPIPGGTEAKEWAVQNGLVKKLYGFRGPNAESCAFAVEYFLVSTIYGTYAIDNDTNGNQKSGSAVFLARPKYFNATRDEHQFIWSKAVTEFVRAPEAPTNTNTWWPALQTFYADQMSDALNLALQALGLHPVASVSEGHLRDPQALMRPNLNVTGAADCMLTFTTDPGRPYRLDLRLSATRNELMINLRPSTHAMSARLAHGQFIQYLENHVFTAGIAAAGYQIRGGPMLGHYGGVAPIKNRDDWPFYKPFAPNGDGRKAIWFPVQWSPDEPALMTFPATAISGINWLDPQQGQMSLTEALQALVCAWPI